MKGGGKSSSLASGEEEKENRKQLFSTTDDPDNIRQRRVKEQRAQDVTASLMELRQMLHTQVESNTHTLHSLVNSSNTIETTKTKMEDIGDSMKTSDRLIAKYERRELTDKVLIGACLVLFFGVVLYILQDRLLGWIW